MLCEPIKTVSAGFPTSHQSFLKQQINAQFSYGISSKVLLCVCRMCVGPHAVTHVSKRGDTLWNQFHPSACPEFRNEPLVSRFVRHTPLLAELPHQPGVQYFQVIFPISGPEDALFWGQEIWAELNPRVCDSLLQSLMPSFTSGPHGFC